MALFSRIKNTFFCSLLSFCACGQSNNTNPEKLLSTENFKKQIEVGANQTKRYLPLLEDKRIGVVANQTSVIFRELREADSIPVFTHLVDSLLSLGVNISRVFAPEHGFRGEADAGEAVSDGTDLRTGLPLISLYGPNKKPSSAQLSELDLVLFDIQDVGVRFYTYIATLQLVMEACVAEGIPVLVLDRPNPNGHYVDGPLMEEEHMGFLGMTPIPLVYGMTIGEYAEMINGEGWLEGGAEADLTVIKLRNYDHEMPYSLPIRPSPNLPNDRAINLYPSLGLFEGTRINAGRGTEFQFQRFGAPFLDPEVFTFSYIPEPNFGAKKPKHKGRSCYGKELISEAQLNRVSLQWLLEAYQNCLKKDLFFNPLSFAKHAGTRELQKQIEAGMSEQDIRESWATDLEAFGKIRKKYLLYP